MGASRSCLSCGYRLAGLGVPRCPECGRGFDPAACETFGVRLAHPELLLETELEWIGEAIRAELLAADILCVVEHALIGVTGISTRRRVRIYVDADDLARAREVLERQRLQRSRLEEAGHWRCPRCGEDVPGDFERCWSCGSAGAEAAEDSARDSARDSTNWAGEGAARPAARPPVVDAAWRSGRHEARGRGVALLGAAAFLLVAGLAILARGQAGPGLLVLVVAMVMAMAALVTLLWAR